MGDGVAKESGLLICTDSFSILDVVSLSNILRIKYGLKQLLLVLQIIKQEFKYYLKVCKFD